MMAEIEKKTSRHVDIFYSSYDDVRLKA